MGLMPAAVRHSVPCVDREVQDRALKLAWVESDRVQRGIEFEFDLDRFPGRASKEGLEIPEQPPCESTLTLRHGTKSGHQPHSEVGWRSSPPATLRRAPRSSWK